ncbi:MAG: putative transposase [Petrotoga sp.]|nr:putative transposase [Petrotoga sp.]
MSRVEKQSLIDWHHQDVSVSRQCQLLNLNRTTLYYKPAEPSEEEIKIKHRIDEIYTEFPYYGYRRITEQLKKDGFEIGTTAVRRHMHEMGIMAIYPVPNTSKRNMEHKIYPYLLRGLSITEPNQVWGIDITYIRLNRSWLYLVAIIDWFSRYVLSWELDQTLDIHFVLEAVNMAFKIATPTIMNSDQGSHFTSFKYTKLIEGAGARISMDSKGRALDNAITERLWRTVKYEEVYINDYDSPREARLGISQYFEKYNNRRLHQSLGYKTPAEVYFM